MKLTDIYEDEDQETCVRIVDSNPIYIDRISVEYNNTAYYFIFISGSFENSLHVGNYRLIPEWSYRNLTCVQEESFLQITLTEYCYEALDYYIRKEYKVQ